MTASSDIHNRMSEARIGKELLHEIVRRIVEAAGPERIILFGSAAKGRMGKDSDLDLLVVKSGVPHRRKLAQQIHLRMFGVGVPMDIVVVTPEDIEACKDKVGTIIGSALREGEVIYASRR
ncbi:MAG: nucleotidyltransferase domain-containing protein [Thermodesulfobacteriota bacterium]